MQVPEAEFTEFENNFFTAEVPRKDGTKVKMRWKIFKVQDPAGELKASLETILILPRVFQMKYPDNSGGAANKTGIYAAEGDP